MIGGQKVNPDVLPFVVTVGPTETPHIRVAYACEYRQLDRAFCSGDADGPVLPV